MMIILWYTAHECPLCALSAATHIGIYRLHPVRASYASSRIVLGRCPVVVSIYNTRPLLYIVSSIAPHFPSFRIRDRVYINIMLKYRYQVDVQRYEMCIFPRQFDRRGQYTKRLQILYRYLLLVYTLLPLYYEREYDDFRLQYNNKTHIAYDRYFSRDFLQFLTWKTHALVILHNIILQRNFHIHNELQFNRIFCLTNYF